MAKRIVLHIDKHVHINGVIFEIYRSTEAGVDDQDTLIMEVFEPSTIKTTYEEQAELLVRDPDTPYAFFAARHFEVNPFPDVFVGSTQVEPRDILLFPDQKSIEIHNGDLGLADGRNVYMTYHYQAMDIWDDTRTQSGVHYIGPPATGIRSPSNLTLAYNDTTRKLEIRYDFDPNPITYYYRIRAKDLDGNYSPWSLEHFIDLAQNPGEVFFRIERSPDRQTWEHVALSNMFEWYDDVSATDAPLGVQNVVITPLGSKVAEIMLDNPWYVWHNQPRTSQHYRVRAEDMEGVATDWIYVDPVPVFVKPKELLIRRKVDNGIISTETGDESVDVFRLTEADVDPMEPKLTLIDDQLSEAEKYGYTFFYTDELNLKATPYYEISDHRDWKNIILFTGHTRTDLILTADFSTSFEWADKIIDIGITP